MSGYIDVRARNCYALGYSYGEICVGCGCCSTNKLKKTKARIKYHEWELDRFRNFADWDDDPEFADTQRKNVAASIEWLESKLNELREQLAELENNPQKQEFSENVAP